jgi:hypothetical protein
MALYDAGHFIGFVPGAQKLPFLGSDSECLFEKNRLQQPAGWPYHTLAIDYDLNTHGHRCQPIENLDLDNYILFVGCSLTMGIGVRLEHSYPYLVAQELGMSYYNLAVGGTGDDVLAYNTTMWRTKIQQPPRLVIIQWSSRGRLVCHDGPENWANHGSWSNSRDYITGQHYLDKLGYFRARRTLLKRQLVSLYSCPVMQFAPVTGASTMMTRSCLPQ